MLHEIFKVGFGPSNNALNFKDVHDVKVVSNIEM